ncbi:MAG: enoyl-CoA hydratase/isomerase family protein [Myxococcota bacterium]|nr:enoyl-CoA hydratase/isomerase family protein [Myxococcota bacterium]
MSSLLIQENDGVVVLTLNRPEVKNAIDDSLMSGLDDAVQSLSRREDLVSVVVTGAGSDAFCAGGDLKWLQAFDTPEKGQGMSRRMQDILHRLSALPAPVIAVLNGYAFGGGTEIALAADMRILEAHAFLCFKQAQVGVMTGWGGGGRLLSLVGYGRAFELLTTCPKVKPQEAIAMGLANREAASGEGLEVAQHLSDQLRRASATSVCSTKALLRRAAGTDPRAAAEIEAELFGDVWMSVEHQEALLAFSQKRRPSFRS